jgi:hypothetical protein
VYLVADERERLERLADQLDATKSDVVRRGLLALERELTSPAAHPALRLIGIAGAELPGLAPADAARAHDQLLVDAEEAAWARPKAKRVGRGTPSKKKRRAR